MKTKELMGIVFLVLAGTTVASNAVAVNAVATSASKTSNVQNIKKKPNKSNKLNDENEQSDENKMKDESPTYISFIQGNVKDSDFGGGKYGELKYENNDGKYKEVVFNWGHKDQVGIATGVKLDSDNKIKEYLLGLIMPNNSEFRIRQFTIKDRLSYTDSAWDPNPGQVYVLGDIDAQALEITYIKHISQNTNSVADFEITYGKSNLPQKITVNSTEGLFGNQKDLIVDIKPEIQYLDFGFGFDGLKNALKNGSEQGWDIYFAGDVLFGLSRFTVGNSIYNWGTGKPSSKWNISGKSGTNINFLYHIAPTVAYIFKAGGVRSAFKLGFYYDADFGAFNDLLKLNKISSNNTSDTNEYFWSNSGRSIYGYFAGVGITF